MASISIKNGPLSYACSDADAIAGILQAKFGFTAGKVTLLKNEDATRTRILESFLRFADAAQVHPDDRLFVFFAGHGHTRSGQRGEVGYLVPVDGTADQLASLIRWDDLTRNADLIPAKHVLFVMDACYGGLAVTRYVPPGTIRFLEDMLQRYSRQVLTAGKADEVVADSGGPRPGHSVFTGHLLDALNGAASSNDGAITANGIMAYVYDRVAKDRNSHQTPHYGFLDGDGDFIFFPECAGHSSGLQKGDQVKVSVPASLAEQPDASSQKDPLEMLKEYLSEPRHRIKLNDLVNKQIRATAEVLAGPNFRVSEPTPTAETFASRVKEYETAISGLQAVTALLGRWATGEQRSILQNVLARLSDDNSGGSGKILWLGLRWYPITLLVYTAVISALHGNAIENLAAVISARTSADGQGRGGAQPVIVPAVNGMLEVNRCEGFKLLPGHERHYTPQSEYLFKALQPMLEDLLLVGNSYEPLFDRAEVMISLCYADLSERSWAPVGRFGWKYSSGARLGQDVSPDPFSEVKREAAKWGENWPPLRAGLFSGSYSHFEQLATDFENGMLKRLQWF